MAERQCNNMLAGRSITGRVAITINQVTISETGCSGNKVDTKESNTTRIAAKESTTAKNQETTAGKVVDSPETTTGGTTTTTTTTTPPTTTLVMGVTTTTTTTTTVTATRPLRLLVLEVSSRASKAHLTKAVTSNPFTNHMAAVGISTHRCSNSRRCSLANKAHRSPKTEHRSLFRSSLDLSSRTPILTVKSNFGRSVFCATSLLECCDDAQLTERVFVYIDLA